MQFDEINETIVSFQYPTRFGTDFHYYLVQHPEGNVLVGCPEKWDPKIARMMAEIGGIDRIFLTHRHDVGAIAEYKERLGAKVIMHQSGQRHMPIAIDLAFEHRVIDQGLQCVHTPGHTPENACLLVQNTPFLFTGDTICIDAEGVPFIYRHQRDSEEMSDEEVRRIAQTMHSLDFTDVYSGVSGGYCLVRAKELLMDRYRHLLT